jgi:hypothetical protein
VNPSLFDAAAERVALETGRPLSQERLRLAGIDAAPAGPLFAEPAPAVSALFDLDAAAPLDTRPKRPACENSASSEQNRCSRPRRPAAFVASYTPTPAPKKPSTFTMLLCDVCGPDWAALGYWTISPLDLTRYRA